MNMTNGKMVINSSVAEPFFPHFKIRLNLVAKTLSPLQTLAIVKTLSSDFSGLNNLVPHPEI
jgi:hypothetical protein